jgi:hypothetical protein
MQLEITTTPEGVQTISSLGIGALKFEQMRVFRLVI